MNIDEMRQSFMKEPPEDAPTVPSPEARRTAAYALVEGMESTTGKPPAKRSAEVDRAVKSVKGVFDEILKPEAITEAGAKLELIARGIRPVEGRCRFILKSVLKYDLTGEDLARDPEDLATMRGRD